MTILAPGTFRVSDYRKPVPAATSRAVRKRYEEDHRPPLTNRPYDTDAGDFIPPQHDPEHLFLIEKAEHAERTFGRKAGAEKTVTTRGSDVGERARVRSIQKTNAAHKVALDAKHTGAEPVRAPKPKSPVPPPSWPPKGARKIQGRGFQQRRRQ